jgi:trehalose-6-phosphatase
VTDEDAFQALRGRGISIYVGDQDQLDRETAADFTLDSVDEVEHLLDTLAR